MLPMGTLKCPLCNEVLHFKVWGGMRLKRQDGKTWKYDAVCPPCKEYWEVKAPAD